MISKDGSDAYRLYRENIKAVKSGLHTLEQKLDLVTQTSIPLNKNDWTKTKENVVYSFEELYEKTNDELASKYGDGAATLYKYSQHLTEYMWFSNSHDFTPKFKHDITRQALMYGAKMEDVQNFLKLPKPSHRYKLLSPVFEFYNYVSFFISYSHNDDNFVNKLLNFIEQPIIKIWRDKKSLNAGDSISSEIEKAIETCDYFCLVLSNASLGSGWVQREYRTALNYQIKLEKPKIIPILIEKVKLPAFLMDIKYADFSGSFEDGLDSILNSIKQT